MTGVRSDYRTHESPNSRIHWAGSPISRSSIVRGNCTRSCARNWRRCRRLPRHLRRPSAQRILAPADPAELQAWFFERQSSDGFPVIAPIPEAVAKMVEGSGRRGQDLVGVVPPRGGIATIEQIAVNAVMAGCRPQHMPVLVTAVEAMLEPRFNLASLQATTHPVAPLLIVHGPIARELNMNAGAGTFGPSSMANAVIGRAITVDPVEYRRRSSGYRRPLHAGCPEQVQLLHRGEPRSIAMGLIHHRARLGRWRERRDRLRRRAAAQRERPRAWRRRRHSASRGRRLENAWQQHLVYRLAWPEGVDVDPRPRACSEHRGFGLVAAPSARVPVSCDQPKARRACLGRHVRHARLAAGAQCNGRRTRSFPRFRARTTFSFWLRAAQESILQSFRASGRRFRSLAKFRTLRITCSLRPRRSGRRWPRAHGYRSSRSGHRCTAG